MWPAAEPSTPNLMRVEPRVFKAHFPTRRCVSRQYSIQQKAPRHLRTQRALPPRRLQRHQQNANQAARAHRDALAAHDTARATRDRISAELQALNPWRPFTGSPSSGTREPQPSRQPPTQQRPPPSGHHRRGPRPGQRAPRPRPPMDHGPRTQIPATTRLSRRPQPRPRRPHPKRPIEPATGVGSAHPRRPARPQPRRCQHLGSRLAAIGQYRDIWNITADHRPLGPRPQHYNDPHRPTTGNRPLPCSPQPGRQLGCGHNFDRELRRTSA